MLFGLALMGWASFGGLGLLWLVGLGFVGVCLLRTIIVIVKVIVIVLVIVLVMVIVIAIAIVMVIVLVIAIAIAIVIVLLWWFGLAFVVWACCLWVVFTLVC